MFDPLTIAPDPEEDPPDRAERLRQQFEASSNAGLVDLIGQFAGVATAAHAAVLDAVAVMDHRESYRSDGALSMAEWLVYRLGLRHDVASEWVRVAHALGDLPLIAAAYSDATLSWDKVRVLSRFATLDTEEQLLEDAAALNVQQLERLGRRVKGVTVHESNERDAKRALVVRRDARAGAVRLWGWLPEDQGALVADAIEDIADNAPRDPDSGLYDPYEQRCADALVSLASRHLAGEQAAGAARATMVVHADAGVLQGGDGVAELDDGTAISTETVGLLACDSSIQLVFDGRDGTPVGIGRRSRTIPEWLHRQLRERDLGCRFPGCSRMRLVHGHHIEYWDHGGPTDLDNLTLLCLSHHRKVHHGGWKVRGDPNGVLEFVRPDGRVLRAGPPELRPEFRKRLLQPVLSLL